MRRFLYNPFLWLLILFVILTLFGFIGQMIFSLISTVMVLMIGWLMFVLPKAFFDTLATNEDWKIYPIVSIFVLVPTSALIIGFVVACATAIMLICSITGYYWIHATFPSSEYISAFFEQAINFFS